MPRGGTFQLAPLPRAARARLSGAGHGPSRSWPGDANPTSVRTGDCADDAAALMNWLELDRVLAGGYSMGGHSVPPLAEPAEAQYPSAPGCGGI